MLLQLEVFNRAQAGVGVGRVLRNEKRAIPTRACQAVSNLHNRSRRFRLMPNGQHTRQPKLHRHVRFAGDQRLHERDGRAGNGRGFIPVSLLQNRAGHRVLQQRRVPIQVRENQCCLLRGRRRGRVAVSTGPKRQHDKHPCQHPRLSHQCPLHANSPYRVMLAASSRRESTGRNLRALRMVL